MTPIFLRRVLLSLAVGVPAIVLAQSVATSTETSAGTSTPFDASSSVASAEPVSEMQSAAPVATTSDVSATSTSTSTQGALDQGVLIQVSRAEIVPGALPVAVRSQVDGIADLENKYIRKNGKYLQVLPGNKLPEYERGIVNARLGDDLPRNYRVDVYESPLGVGYQVIYSESGTTYSIGYGPEATDRTYTIQPQLNAASSTPVQ